MDILKLIENNKQIKKKNQVFSISNSKLDKNNIASFNLPQGFTCPFAGECLKFCYASKGNYRFPSVKNKYQKNYKLSLTDDFINIVNDSIESLPNVDFFRIHSSGDFYNKKYINKWIQIAKDNPEKVFYAYTKSIILFKGLQLPNNLLIIQSEGTKKDSIYLDYTKPFARIFKTKEQIEQAVKNDNFIDASESDLQAVKGILLKKNIALLLH